MKNIKGFALGLTMGLALAISSLAFAQEAKTPTSDKASCCAESCSMKHAKGHDANKHSADGGACCCCSDSCDMHMKDKQKEKTE